MDKKKLKVVDIDDLETDHSLAEDEVEITTEAKVNITDLQKKKPSFTVKNEKPPVKQKHSPEEYGLKKIDPSIIKGARFKHYKGNGSQQSIVHFMSQKYKFDRKRYSSLRIAVYLTLITLGVVHGKVTPYIESFRESKMAIAAAAPLVMFDFYDMYASYFVLICFVLFWQFPIKIGTDGQVEIFYDGLIVPSEVFPLGRPKRQRLKWSQIDSIDYKSRYGVPFVQLINKKHDVIGEIRLDFDHIDEFYKILDTYCPEENPLRNLFTNAKKA